MKQQFFLSYLVSLTIYLTVGAFQPAGASPSHSGFDGWANKRHSDQYPNRRYARSFAANLNVGQPRTVRMIYFLPNDRPYRADVVQRMKDEILNIQTFFAEQMEAHGYGRKTFRIETDAHGEPTVHRVNGKHSDSYYLDDAFTVEGEIEKMFDFYSNIYFIVVDNSIGLVCRFDGCWGGWGGGRGKQGGAMLVPGAFDWIVVAHELGHAFGLGHDFRDGRYILSYGPGEDRLAACSAKYLAVHPYFNANIPIEERDRPHVELISPHSYPSDSKSVSIRVRVSDPDGLHQVILRAAQPDNRATVKSCRELLGENSAIIKFDYDGVIPSAHDPAYSRSTSLLSPLVHEIVIEAVDAKGDVGRSFFALFSDALQPLSKISGDNQHGLPNTPLPVPFVVELRDLNDGSPLLEVPISFTVTAGGGRLSVEHTETDWSGRAESVLTLGPNLGTNTVAVSAAGIEGTVTFTAVATAPVEIPDKNLRAAIEWPLGKASGAPITMGDMARLETLYANEFNISDLTGLEHATNLTELALQNNSISDISLLAGLTNLTGLHLSRNNITDPSPVEGLTNLTALGLSDNNITDLSAVEGLENLTWLGLSNNNITDLAPLEGLTNLTELGLANNNITDISSLSRLTNLTWLNLRDNNIKDILPLVENTELGRGDTVYLNDNPLSPVSIKTHIPKLQEREVLVEFDNIPDPNLRDAIARTLGKASGDTITTADMANLTELWAEDNNIRDLTGLVFATNLTYLNLQLNNILDISPLAGLTKLETLILDYNSISDISVVVGLTNLTELGLSDNDITDLSAVEELENLTWLGLSNNNITDFSPLAGLTNLTWLQLFGNPILDWSPLCQLLVENPDIEVDVEPDCLVVEIPDPNLRAAIERTLGKASGATLTIVDMARLTPLDAPNANITDLTGLESATNLTYLNLGFVNAEGRRINSNSVSNLSSLAGLTKLTRLNLWGNNISDILPLAKLIQLTELELSANNISDISPVAGLTNLTYLDLDGNSISDISGVSELTGLTRLEIGGSNISDLSPLANLTNLTILWLYGNNISDLSPLVTNTGLGDGDEVYVDENPLSYTSINTHIPILRERGAVVHANNLKPPTLEYLLSASAGLNLIHVPLKVSAVDGVAQTIESISDLYDTFGGTNAVNFLITYDTSSQAWLSYLSSADRGSASDRGLTDEMGIIAGMKTAVTVRLRGEALGIAGSSAIALNQGLNLVGLPLRDPTINRVSDLLRLDGIWGNVDAIILNDGGDFKIVRRARDPGDIPITGGQGFILTADQAATVTLSGEGWTNVTAPAATPKLLTGLPVTNTTAVLALKGSIVDEVSAVNRVGFRVAVKNLSTGRQVVTTIADAEAGYRFTVVDIETMRAARFSDVLEISAQSTNPFIGVEPLRYAVTAEDVSHGWIQLPALVAYEIPQETELLANYPNPFNPETWIPYRLAEDGFVTLTIYDGKGHVVRTLDVGHRIAAVYESRSKAIYWDGRNNLGEQVSSGVYFYHLLAGSYSQTRKMLILK